MEIVESDYHFTLRVKDSNGRLWYRVDPEKRDKLREYLSRLDPPVTDDMVIGVLIGEIMRGEVPCPLCAEKL